jgi:hypothetical protein
MSILLSIAKSWKILAPVFIAVMALWLMISCAILFSSVRAEGMVTQLIEKHSGDDVYYCPVTVFRDSSGVEHTIRSSGGSNPPRFPVGAKVSVLYRTQNPDAGYLEDRFMLWIAPSLLIVISVFYGAVGFIISRLLQKKESRNAA